MNKNQLVEFFGSATKAANAIGVSKSTISLWGEYPPPLRQLQIEKMTYGNLKAESDVIQQIVNRKHKECTQ